MAILTIISFPKKILKLSHERVLSGRTVQKVRSSDSEGSILIGLHIKDNRIQA